MTEYNEKARVTKNRLIFEGTQKTGLSPFFRKKKFELLLSNIKIIGVKYGMFFDDYVTVIFISKQNKKYFLPYEYIQKDTVETLNSTFDINLNYTISTRLDFEIEEFRNKILFPKGKAKKTIFKDKNLSAGLYLLFGKLFLMLHYADGILTNQVKLYSVLK